MNKLLSSYQNPEGQLQDRLAPRTNEIRYKNLDWLNIVNKRTVLDIGCNNGFFTREALRRGARRAVGVDISDCIQGARQLTLEEGSSAEFWQMDVDSKEFRRHCEKFEVVLLLSVLTHVNNKEEFLNWLDGITEYALVFESNHGEKNKQHIDLVQKHFWFESVEYIGPQDTEAKPHYLWVCRKHNHSLRYPEIGGFPVEFIPMDKIIGWDEETILKQDTTYDVHSESFKRLLNDIRTRGAREPIIVQKEGEFYRGFQGGHRYLAAKQLGYKNIPAKVIRGFVYKHLEKQRNV